MGSIACFWLSTALSSFALEDEQSETYDLKQYVVTSSRIELPLDQVGSTVDVLTSADFEKTRQPFLNEALRTVPGLALRNNGGPGQVFGITTRGLNTNRPTVLIDGIEVSNPGSGQIINFGTIASSNVQRVEVLKGAQSSLYGADALAGVISIQTKDGATDPGSSLNVMTGAFDTYQVSASTRGISAGWSYNASLSWYESQGYSVQDPDLGDAWADDDLYRNFNASLNLAYAVSETSTAQLIVYHVDSKAEYDPGDPSFVFGEPFADNFTDTRQTFAKLAVITQPSDTWDSSISAGYNRTRDTSFSAFPFSSHGDRFEVDWNNTVQAVDTYKFVGGARYEDEENKSDAGHRNEKSVYVENVLLPSERLTLTGGGRFDDNSAYGEETTYRGTFSYVLDETEDRFIKLRGSYGTSFQAPSFFQLFSFYGNPALKAESGIGWDVGVEGSAKQGNVTFGITYFDYAIYDKFVFDFVTNSFANEDRYFSHGVESFFRFRINENIGVSVSHTYADAEYADGAGAERVPNNIYSLSVDWETMNDRLLLNLTGLFVSSQLSLRGDPVSLPSHSVFNVSGRLKISETWDFWARVDNVFDEDYQEIASFETPGLSAYVGANFRF